MRRTYLAAILGLLIGFSLVIGIFVLHPVYINICEASQYGAEQKCEPSNILYVAFLNLGRILTHPEFWTAIATIAIACFTFTLKRSTDKLWDAGERQLKLARDEFVSTHRPKLRIRRITPVRPFLPENQITAIVEVANIGETEATVIQSGVDIYVLGDHFDARPVPFDNLPPIPAGMQANLTIVGDKRFVEAEIDAIETGTTWLRLLGIITYVDANGTKRGTSFARVYDRRLHRFAKVPSDDQEADREYED